MPIAFLNLNEPHAWLIRGLVEYGWRDLTGRGGVVPPGAPGGFDVSRLPGSIGKDGITLIVPAERDGRRVEEGIYEFEVKVTGSAPSIKIVARCPDCNYLDEFPYDPQNPSWAAGYLVQGVSRHVADFVAWRLSGGELSWSQRAGVPEVQGDPCTGELVRFVQTRLRKVNSSFEQGPAEGWWMGATPSPWGAGPVAALGQGGGDPVYVSAAGRAELAAMGGATASVERVTALDTVARPGGWLSLFVGACMFLGVLALLNALVTYYFYGSGRMFALVANILFGLVIVGGGLLAKRGIRCFREVREHWSVYFGLAYIALTPVCCLLGLPLAAWGLWVWFRPEVRAGRVHGPAPASNAPLTVFSDDAE